MLEILVLIGLCKWIGSMLREKGRNPLVFQIFVVLGWIVGEVGGMIVGGIIHVLQNPNADEFNPLILVFMIAGAAVGAGIPFFIAFLLPSVKEETYLAKGNYPSRPFDPNNPYAP
jgi:hypothetical protein